MLKNISNLGTTLNKKEQKAIQGGQFCVIHCGAECYAGHLSSADEAACARECQRIGDEINRGSLGGF